MTEKHRTHHRSLSMDEQFYQSLHEKLEKGIGRSKHEDEQHDACLDKIYSYNTFKTYRARCHAFVLWMRVEHPDVFTMKKARKFIPAYIEHLTASNYSSWTIQTAAMAIYKAYQMQPGDIYYVTPPQRKRCTIKRSRDSVKQDWCFSVSNHHDLVDSCKATGLRRHEITYLKGGECCTRVALEDAYRHGYEAIRKLLGPALKGNEDQVTKLVEDALLFNDQNLFVFVRDGKGGRQRLAPIIGENKEAVYDRIASTSADRRVWNHISHAYDIHADRSEYATAIYRHYARRVEDIPYVTDPTTGKRSRPDIYFCRKDERGRKLDKKAMLLASKALGHNRVSIIADHYLRGI